MEKEVEIKVKRKINVVYIVEVFDEKGNFLGSSTEQDSPTLDRIAEIISDKKGKVAELRNRFVLGKIESEPEDDDDDEWKNII